jgi:hypothetical protein
MGSISVGALLQRAIVQRLEMAAQTTIGNLHRVNDAREGGYIGGPFCDAAEPRDW